uniref:Protein cappuccino n=1 Tax=Lygus hesperus TaxID=30085 RepID=A0A0A9Z608_LYGHE
MENEAEKLTKDYSNYLVVNVSDDLKSVGEAIDDTLTRLDEFSGLVDVISCHVNPETSVDILSRKEELFALFQRVRKLEFAVAQVRQTVDAFDHLVATAETELNATTEGK